MTKLPHHPTDSWLDVVDYFRGGAPTPDGSDNPDWKGWLFRGQRSSAWGLQTSFDRALERAGHKREDARDIENGMLRHFRRQAHHYVRDVPAPEAWMEWLALMQHHGAPTRLLDWSYSFWVATYFALEDVKPDDTCSVWAFNAAWWNEQVSEYLVGANEGDVLELVLRDPNTKKPETVDRLLRPLREDGESETPLPMVVPVNPDRLNERLVIQQGAFTAVGDVRRSFKENLAAVHGGDQSAALVKLDLHCTRKFMLDALRDLRRMNISRATLFPGLDGFARDLVNLAFLRDQIAPETLRLKAAG